MPKNPRGTCHVCNRDDVLLISNKGPCHRCYKQGKTQPKIETTVIRSTPTNEEKAAVVAKPVKPCPSSLQEAPVQAIEKPAAPASSTTAYNVDIIAALDEAWQMKRAKFADDLSAQTTSAERLKLGFRMLATITSVGY